MKLDKLFLLRFLLLMALSFKVSHAVIQNISLLTDSTSISYVIDLDESENEDKKELDESEKIHQFVNLFLLNNYLDYSNHTSFYKLDYKILHLDFTTPPPELS